MDVSRTFIQGGGGDKKKSQKRTENLFMGISVTFL